MDGDNEQLGDSSPTWADVFNAGRLWCPVYGAIPRPADSVPNSPAGRLAEIIERARELVPRDFDFPPAPNIEVPAFEAPGWCPETINGEPPDAYVRAARQLVGPGWLHVIQYAPHYGGADYSHGLDQVPNRWALLHFARRAASRGSPETDEAAREMTEGELLALVAIAVAFRALRDLLVGSGSDSIASRSLAALGLLAQAEFAAVAAERAESAEQAEADIESARAERDALAPDAQRGRKVLDGARRSGRAASERCSDDREIWRQCATRILRSMQRRTPSIRELARLVAMERHPEMTEGERENLADSRRRWLKDLLP